MSANGSMAQRNAREALEDVQDLGKHAGRAAEYAQRAFPEIAKQAREVIDSRLEQFRGQSRDAADVAGEQLEQARIYVVDRVHERPLTATLAAAGIGFLIGVVLASGGRR
jgi:ElaB/YqjD/DUF883 family membrane-anchored ribosome-binding protein